MTAWFELEPRWLAQGTEGAQAGVEAVGIEP